jgi:hypothetical protein
MTDISLLCPYVIERYPFIGRSSSKRYFKYSILASRLCYTFSRRIMFTRISDAISDKTKFIIIFCGQNEILNIASFGGI